MSLLQVHDSSVLPFLASMAQLPATALLLVAAYLHVSGRGSRKWKYELLLSYGLIAAFCTGYVNSGLRTWGGSWSLALAVLLGVGFLLWWLLFLAEQFLIPLFLGRRLVRGGLQRWLYWFRAPVWWLLAIMFLPLFILYCLLRYHLLAAAAKTPILYFRSFGLKSAPEAFRKIVVPATRRYGVIEGLISAEQRASDLNELLEFSEHAHFIAADSTAWQHWVSDRLRVAAAVIIDATSETRSVAWEIDEAIASVGISRVAVIYSGDPPSIPVSVWHLNYNLSKSGIKASRADLTAWLRVALSATRGR